MVGLPGCGKTYIARKIARYLRWNSYRTRVFSLAKYRYVALCKHFKLILLFNRIRLDKVGTKTAEFFDPSSTTYYQMRVKLMEEAIDDCLRYLSRGGMVAIIDGTNTTVERRQLLRKHLAKDGAVDTLWIESIYAEGVHLSTRQWDELRHSPDFLDKKDYSKRLDFYRQNYVNVGEDEGSFLKVSRRHYYSLQYY